MKFQLPSGVYCFLTVSLAVLSVASIARAQDSSIESLERSRNEFGAVYEGKEKLGEIKKEILAGNNAGARRILTGLRAGANLGTETALLESLLFSLEHNYKGALQSLGRIKGDHPLLTEQASRFKKAARDSDKLRRLYGKNYAAQFTIPHRFDEGVYLPDRNLFIFSADGILYRYNTRTREKSTISSPGGGKTLGMTASLAPELTAVAVKSGERYVIKVFSGTDPSLAADLEAKVNSSGSSITPFISMDGRTFLFASNRSSARGGFDIYLSTFDEGRWSDPINAGAVINSPGNDINPWLHADTDTLFYSSDGRRGFGGHDIYAVKLSEGTEPVNLGMPINDIFDQSTQFSVDLGGFSLYRAAGGRVSKMPILYSIATTPMRFVYGRVSLDGKGAESPVAIKIDSDEGFYAGVESLKDGRYSLSLPYDRNFTLMPVSSGYLLHTSDLEAGKGGLIGSQDFDLPKIYHGKKIQYEINFDAGNPDIPGREKAKLKELVSMLKDNPHVKFEISGHSSGIGTKDRVDRIAKLRVASIMDYLLTANVNPTRLKVTAYGGEKKLNEAQKSRRVEISVVSWDESMATVDTGAMRFRLGTVSKELNTRRKLNFSIPGYALAGAAIVCFSAGGYYTYKSIDANSNYDDLVSEYRDIPYSSWKMQVADEYQRKLDDLESDYRKFRKYSIYAYVAGGTLSLASAVFFISDVLNRATIKDLEKEAESLKGFSFDVKVAPEYTEVAFQYRF